MRNGRRWGTLAGIAAGLLALAVLAIWLLQAEGAAAPALVAIWLWLLPALAISGIAGWLVGAGIEQLGGRR